jgi:hypothetical protein
MEQFQEEYERIRDTLLSDEERLVCRAYAWHWIHHYGKRIELSGYRESVNRALLKMGRNPLSIDQFKKCWGKVRRIMTRELSALQSKIKEALSHERV